MRRASLLLLLFAALAHADEEPHAAAPAALPGAAGRAAEGRRGPIDGRGLYPAGSAAEGRRGPIDGRGLYPAGSAAEGRRGSIDPRDGLAQQLAEQAATIASAQAIVATKLSAADALRGKRVRAAYRVLHTQLAADATPEERMATARRRAAARLLLHRDAGERGILAEELGHLTSAADRARADAARLAAVVLPTEIVRPVRGKIARKFGTLEHERSKAMLSRHGVDIEVEDHANVVAPADGIVTYAGPIRGLDRGAIIDHGTFLSVIAKLGDLAVPVGAPVVAGDRLGRAARHRVYLEIRVKLGPGGLPIDPEPLLAR